MLLFPGAYDQLDLCILCRKLLSAEGTLRALKSIAYRSATLIVCVLCLAVPQLTVAAETEDVHPYLENEFSLDIGVFYPDRQLDLRVNGSLGLINDEIDFDERLRLKRNDDTFSAQLSWRFRGRWSVVGQYFKFSDTRRAVLEEDVEWGNVVFGAGTSAAIGSHLSLTRIFFGRQLDTNKAHDFSIGIGLHWLDIGAFIEGEILINGTPAGARRSVSEQAPLPNIGAWYNYSISPRWAFRSRLDLLSADVGDYDGLLVNVAFGLNYHAFENVGFGLNYNYFKLDIGIDKSGWRGDIESVFEGVYVYASFYY